MQAAYLRRVGHERFDEHLDSRYVRDEQAFLHPLAYLLALFGSLDADISTRRQALAGCSCCKTYLLGFDTHQVPCRYVCAAEFFHKFLTLCALSAPRGTYVQK